MAALVLFFLLGLTSSFAAPKDRTQLQLVLDINRVKWGTQNAVAYHMTIKRSCKCPKDERGTFKLSVKNEEVVSVSPKNAFSKTLPTVSGLFEKIQDAIDDKKIDVIRVKYDNRLGYPTSVFIDPSTDDAGDAISYTISVTNIVEGTPVAPKPKPDDSGSNGFLPRLHKFQFNRWRKSGLVSYKFKFERLCFCPPDFRGPFIITVKKGHIVKVVFANKPGVPVPHAIRKKLPTIPGLFRLITKEAATAAKVKVLYNGLYGYPFEARIDRIKNAVDDEITYKAKILH